MTFCYWCWCAWSLADQLNSLLGNTVTNQPASLATRWPFDHLLPPTLFSGTGGWRRGGWTRFSWMLPCLLLGARSPNFLKCVSDTIRVIRYMYIDLLDEERAMASTRQVRIRARQATANACLSSLLLLFIISYFGIDKNINGKNKTTQYEGKIGHSQSLWCIWCKQCQLKIYIAKKQGKDLQLKMKIFGNKTNSNEL